MGTAEATSTASHAPVAARGSGRSAEERTRAYWARGERAQAALFPAKPAGASRPLSASAPVVRIVDDQQPMRSALLRLLKQAGVGAEAYESGADFLGSANFEQPGCVLLDLQMPGMGGLEVQEQLNQRGVDLPVIFLTGAGDIPVAVTAMREGALDFIQKPYDGTHLLARVRLAIEHHRREHQETQERENVLARFRCLTPRERDVMEFVVTGHTSKEIARVLGSSHRTIEIHRNHLMEKMTAASIAELVRMRMLLSDFSAQAS